MGKLVLHHPDGTTRDFPLSRERMTIGRRVDNDICLPYPAVSGEHAAVVTILDDSFLEDLNSTNGTLVNGKSISKHFLRDNDEIDVGRHKLVYYSGDEAHDAPSLLIDLEAALGKKAVPTREAPTPLAKPIERAAPPAPVAAPPLHPDRSMAGELTLPLRSPSGGTIDTAALLQPPDEAAPARGKPVEGDAPANAPTLEVLDGPSAGRMVNVGRDEFVLGRVGMQVAAIRRAPEGYRLVHVEGDAVPLINGASLPHDGAVLEVGDTIEIACTRIRVTSG